MQVCSCSDFNCRHNQYIFLNIKKIVLQTLSNMRENWFYYQSILNSFDYKLISGCRFVKLKLRLRHFHLKEPKVPNVCQWQNIRSYNICALVGHKTSQFPSFFSMTPTLKITQRILHGSAE